MKEDLKMKEIASFILADAYHHAGLNSRAIEQLTGVDTVLAKNLLLSLYLSQNNEKKFTECANYLNQKMSLNAYGIGAIDHANLLYKQSYKNGLFESTLDSIFTQHIGIDEFSESMLLDVLNLITEMGLRSKPQALLINGVQTSGDILDIPSDSFRLLKQLIIDRIQIYVSSILKEDGSLFVRNFKNNMYDLKSWAIVMNEGGSLKYHNHEKGWITGTFYLQLSDWSSDSSEGSIEFTHKGPKYPEILGPCPTRIIKPVRDSTFSLQSFTNTPIYWIKEKNMHTFDLQKSFTIPHNKPLPASRCSSIR